jgi:hypothetical protein
MGLALDGFKAFLAGTFGPFMKQVRCPYRVEEDGFKVMTPRDKHLTCLRCGHVVVPDRPTYRCSCKKCRELRGEPQWIR